MFSHSNLKYFEAFGIQFGIYFVLHNESIQWTIWWWTQQKLQTNQKNKTQEEIIKHHSARENEWTEVVVLLTQLRSMMVYQKLEAVPKATTIAFTFTAMTLLLEHTIDSVIEFFSRIYSIIWNQVLSCLSTTHSIHTEHRERRPVYACDECVGIRCRRAQVCLCERCCFCCCCCYCAERDQWIWVKHTQCNVRCQSGKRESTVSCERDTQSLYEMNWMPSECGTCCIVRRYQCLFTHTVVRTAVSQSTESSTFCLLFYSK